MVFLSQTQATTFSSLSSICHASDAWVNLNCFQFSSVPQLCPTPCDPMESCMPRICPSPTPGAYPNLCPLSWWCHPTISSSVTPFSSDLQSFPASGSFHMSQHFTLGGQSIGVSASASVLPMNIQDWFPLGLAGRISLQSKGLSRVFSNTTVQKHQFFGAQLWNPHLTTGKTIALTRQIFVGKAMFLFFNMLSRLVIAFLPRNKCLLILWLQLPSEVILEPPQNKVWHCFHCFPIYLPWSDGTRCHDLSYLNIEF